MKEKFNPQEWLHTDTRTDAMNCVSNTPQSSNLSVSTRPDSVSSDLDLIISRLESAQTDITANYSDWLEIGFAFADELGEAGRDYFHRISRFHSGYSPTDCNRQYNNCLKAKGQGVTMKTFFHLAKQAGINISPTNNPSASPRPDGVSTVISNLSASAGTDSVEEEINTIFNTPQLPPDIYSNLPEILRESADLFQDSVEKDVFLIGSIAVLSGCLPNVQGIYFDEPHSAHLYSFITAPAGSGKGKMKWSKYFGQAIHDHMSEQSRNERAAFESELEQYNNLTKAQRQNQSWFFTAWRNDPTINSMLTMLNAIQDLDKKNDLQNIWPLLTSENPRIVFHLLPMGKLGLPDDLYIKMNSRGKELTEFEHFKSRFSELLPKEHANDFNHKIDQSWSDLFWDLYKDEEDEKDKDIAKRVDNAFLRFFQYITDILITKNEIPVDDQNNGFSAYRKVYGNIENVEFLFSCLDVFSSQYKTNSNFFESLFYIDETDFSIDKTRLFFFNSAIDLFKKCADNYDTSQRTNPFSIGEQLMLYAVINHLTNKTVDLNSRLRKLRNLIANSVDTVRKENMTSLLNTVSEIILNNNIDADSKFNSIQIIEENTKQKFIEENPEHKATIHKLEDHHLLQGCLAMFNFDLELPDYANTFYDVFSGNCHYETISRALLSFGDYSQKYDWRWRLGNHNNSVWRELFTPSQRRIGFQQTKEVLNMLLTHLLQNPQSNLQEIIDFYLASFEQQLDTPKDWKYYFIKYPEFRKNEDGFYYWNIQDKSKPYSCIMMRRTTLGGFNWSPFQYALKERFKDQLNLENYGAPLILIKENASLRISNMNQGYRFEANDDDESELLLENLKRQGFISQDDIFQIDQNQDGIDLEDRIEKGTEFISALLSF